MPIVTDRYHDIGILLDRSGVLADGRTSDNDPVSALLHGKLGRSEHPGTFSFSQASAFREREICKSIAAGCLYSCPGQNTTADSQ